ncbi:MAG TPA: hypothetical protein VNN25_25920 [Thermoanaerobaculia bacterium]|nr:hypothetical protein [Thermoanaerobaculia bacterium]
MKMTEFRSTHPLSDDDLSAIRAKVMAKVAQNQRRGIPLFARLAVAALLVIAVGISFVVRRQTPAAVATSNPQIIRPPHGTPAAPHMNTTIETARAAPPSNAVQSARSSIPKAAARQPVARAVYRPKHRPPQHPEYQTIRMEIRTPDPDVRIIWIANQTPTTTGGNS